MIALYDYVSMTFSGYTVSEIKSLLGLTNYTFEIGTGARGYSSCEFFASVKIFSAPHPSNRFNVWLEMSGSACRSFESYGSGDYQQLLSLALSDSENVHLTRLDIAFDDYSIDPLLKIDEFSPDYVIDLDLIASLVLDRNSDGSNDHYISKSRYYDVQRSSKGTTVYFGSPSSNIRFRIYDKAKERGFKNLHWVRFECQLRDENAKQFAIMALLDYDLGISFEMLINNYIRFIVNDDVNKSRCSTAPFWANIIQETRKISVFSSRGTEYNLPKLQQYLTGTLGNACYTLLETIGEDAFIKSIHENRSPFFPSKYAALISQFKAEERAREEASNNE